MCCLIAVCCCWEEVEGTGYGKLRRWTSCGFFSFSGKRERVWTGERTESWDCSVFGDWPYDSKYSPGPSSIVRLSSISSSSSETSGRMQFWDTRSISLELAPRTSDAFLSPSGVPLHIRLVNSLLAGPVINGSPTLRILPVRLGFSSAKSARVCLVEVNTPS